jgi:hypothetical protein
MAAKFFTGLPLDGPDPECVRGHGETALATVGAGSAPKPSQDHSHRTGSARLAPRERSSAGPVPVSIGRRPPDRACAESPLAGLALPGR